MLNQSTTELRQHQCRLYELCDGLLFISTQLKTNESTEVGGLSFLLQLLHDEMTKTLIEVDNIL